MAEGFDKCKNAMLGHAVADRCQAPTHLALRLSESLCELKRFDASDVMSRYLHLYHMSQYDTGEASRLVYEELKASLTKVPHTFKQKDFKFNVERIYEASRTAHSQLNGLSGGCNAAQRSFPLAYCLQIDDNDLFQVSCDEARLTHFSPVAGQVAGLVNLIARRLFKGDQWDIAVENAFSSKFNLPGEIQEIQRRYTLNQILRPQGNPAYAPNTLHTALYCVTHATSFEHAITLVNEIESVYCPALVGILAGTRWVVPESMLVKSQPETLRDICKVAKRFSEKWNKMNAKK